MGEGERERERERDGRAAASVFAEHAGWLGRIAMALVGDHAAAERVLRSAAAQAGARTATGAGDPTSRAALAGLVRAAAATHVSQLPLRPAAPAAPATERLGAVAAMAARSELAGLRPTEREAVVLSLVGGLDASELAIACNVDVGTAKTRLARGLEQLLGEAGESGGGR